MPFDNNDFLNTLLKYGLNPSKFLNIDFSTSDFKEKYKNHLLTFKDNQNCYFSQVLDINFKKDYILDVKIKDKYINNPSLCNNLLDINNNINLSSGSIKDGLRMCLKDYEYHLMGKLSMTRDVLNKFKQEESNLSVKTLNYAAVQNILNNHNKGNNNKEMDNFKGNNKKDYIKGNKEKYNSEDNKEKDNSDDKNIDKNEGNNMDNTINNSKGIDKNKNNINHNIIDNSMDNVHHIVEESCSNKIVADNINRDSVKENIDNFIGKENVKTSKNMDINKETIKKREQTNNKNIKTSIKIKQTNPQNSTTNDLLTNESSTNESSLNESSNIEDSANEKARTKSLKTKNIKKVKIESNEKLMNHKFMIDEISSDDASSTEKYKIQKFYKQEKIGKYIEEKNIDLNENNFISTNNDSVIILNDISNHKEIMINNSFNVKNEEIKNKEIHNLDSIKVKLNNKEILKKDQSLITQDCENKINHKGAKHENRNMTTDIVVLSSDHDPEFVKNGTKHSFEKYYPANELFDRSDESSLQKSIHRKFTQSERESRFIKKPIVKKIKILPPISHTPLNEESKSKTKFNKDSVKSLIKKPVKLDLIKKATDIKKVPISETFSNETISNKTISNGISSNQIIINEIISNETIINETIINETISNETISTETIINGISSTEISINQISTNQISSNQICSNQTSNNEISIKDGKCPIAKSNSEEVNSADDQYKHELASKKVDRKNNESLVKKEIISNNISDNEKQLFFLLINKNEEKNNNLFDSPSTEDPEVINLIIERSPCLIKQQSKIASDPILVDNVNESKIFLNDIYNQENDEELD